MSNFTKATSYYDYLFIEIADPRTFNWTFMKDPGCILLILAFYLYFVTNLGPKLMENRKPWKLTKTLIAYNLLQVVVNIYLVMQSLDKDWFHYSCKSDDYSNNPDSVAAVRFMHIYVLNKIMDLSDTVFFVLRKKQKQVTFLHLYHHTLLPLFTWIIVKYAPASPSTIVVPINSFVHIIMYSYYLLAALGPQYQKYLWWKKYITTLQLIQFCLVFIHDMQLLFTDCECPKWTVAIVIPNSVFFYYKFNEFYNMSYEIKEKRKKLN